MICTQCKSFSALLNFEEYIVSTMPNSSKILEDIFNSCAAVADEDFKCSMCGCKISNGESYIEDELYHNMFQYLGKQVMGGIACCEECGEGSDIYGLYPSIKSCFYDEDDNPEAIFEEINTSSTIEDIMNDLFYERADAWQPYYKQILEYIKCPRCDNGSGPNYDDKIDYGRFDLYTEVYTQSDIDKFNHDFYGDELSVIKTEISELAQNVTFDELLALKNGYLENKTFVVRTSPFYKLECFIKKMFNDKKWYTLSTMRMLFRTRTSSINSLLSKDELWEPPYQFASHGRYNDIGTTIFYCANNRDVIKKEVALPQGHIYNIAKFITHSPLHLFPINFVFGGNFEGLINEEVPSHNQNSLFKEQYILSNIVSAICLNVGFDGIVYRSTKDNASIDYAIFCKFIKNRDIEIIDVEI